MDVEAEVAVYVPGSDTTRPFEPGDPIVLDVQREDAGLLIGRRAKPSAMCRCSSHHRLAISRPLCPSPYRRGGLPAAPHRPTATDRPARRGSCATAAAAHHAGSMSPADRRIIHMTHAENPTSSRSTGHGENRRVTIQQAPRSSGGQRGGAQATGQAPPPPGLRRGRG